MLTTSGEGSYKMKDVDALTGESIITNVGAHTSQIMERLNPLLDKMN